MIGKRRPSKAPAYTNDLDKVKAFIQSVDTIVIGAGAGLSTAAGYEYDGENFRRYFSDFEIKYRFHDMYSGGFYPYDTLEENWGYWSRYIWVNRYMDIPGNVYDNLLEMVKEKNYFVLTTNVDHCFEKAGFDKKRLFYTQGDYGLWQCGSGKVKKTYDNYQQVKQMILSQGWRIAANNELLAPSIYGGYTNSADAIDWTKLEMEIPSELIPYGEDGQPMTMNLRSDDTFVEDEGWHKAAARYDDFIQENQRSTMIYLEIGVGYNTPGIIKYSFWQKVHANSNAYYICLNKDEVQIPKLISARSIGISGDSALIIEALRS